MIDPVIVPAPPFPVLTVELRPPRWWKGARVFFVTTSIVSLVLGVVSTALVIWLALKDADLDVSLLLTGLLLTLVGALLVQSTRRTSRYRAMSLVLDADHALLPRLRTNEAVRLAYDEIGTIHFMKRPSLRLRIFVRTARGDFFVHRAWLPAGWTLERLTAELVQRRDAARVKSAEPQEPGG